MLVSRRNTRAFLVQVLYVDIFLKNFDISLFSESYKDETHFSKIDMDFLLSLREKIHNHYKEFLAIIFALAPKFDIESLPRIHIIILMIAICEILYFSDIPDKVSVNEAIELAKIFSDESGVKFISGAMGNFFREKEEFLKNPEVNIQFFS